MVFAHAGVKVRVSSRRNGHFRFRASNLACRGSSCLIWPISSVFKNEENARTIRSKSSQASGRCAKTPHVRFVLCFTALNGLRPQNPWVFIGFREAVPGPPKRPLKRLPGARAPKTPQDAPKRPPRGPQEAPKRPQEPEFANGPCVFRVSEVANFWHTLQWFLHLRLQDAPFRASKW